MGALIETDGNGGTGMEKSHAEKICTSSPVIYQLVRVIIAALHPVFPYNVLLNLVSIAYNGFHKCMFVVHCYALYIDFFSVCS